MPLSIADLSRTLKSGRRGSVAIQIGILMTVLIGMAGLGIEIPYLMYKNRQMQTAADSAALSAAVALARGYPSPISTEAKGVAAALGFVSGTANVTVTVNNPPLSGSHTSNSSAVEVIVRQPQTLKLAGLFGVSQYNVTARAVAVVPAPYCILSMDNTPGIGVGLWGGATVTMTGCGMAVNSSGSGALTLQSGGTLNAPLVSIVGQLNNVWSTVNVTSLKVNQPAVADPYANVPMPPVPSDCQNDKFSIGWTPSQTTLWPGTYCKGLSIANGANVLLSGGIYYIKSGDFNIAGGAHVTGTGVTIVLTNEGSGNSYATLSVTNGTDVTLSAPTTDQYGTKGILFFGDRNSHSSNANSINGFTSINWTGVIYLPTQTVGYEGGGAITGCQQLIAWHIDAKLTNLPFDGTCTGTGMKTIGATSTLLVE